jgi:hypothetical protein
MTFTELIAILLTYFAAAMGVMLLWKPHPPEPPPQDRERRDKISFRDFHRNHMAKPVERETSAVYGQKRERA